jgi:hypothetical protein
VPETLSDAESTLVSRSGRNPKSSPTVLSPEECLALLKRYFGMTASPARPPNPTRRQLIWQITTIAIDIPKEFRKYHVRDFPRKPREIWTRNRRAVKWICSADKIAGGNPWPFPHDYRRCGYCGRRMVGLQAEIRRWWEACAWLNGVPVGPCSDDCSALNPKSLDKSTPTRFSSALGSCRAGSHGGRATTDQHEQIDIRRLRRGGLLEVGARFQVGNIQVHNTGETLLLSWSDAHRKRCCAVRLLRTHCNYGGMRRWLQCPMEGCRRRVGVLYVRGDSIACRECSGLSYRSQREEFGVRRLRRAWAVRARLGLSADLAHPLGAKPHGMHRKTYERLQQHYGRLLDQAFGFIRCGQ